MKRNLGVELYRCGLMFGICLLHAIGQTGVEWHGFSSLLLWCVDGFVLITGYFGCTFKLEKVVKLYGIAAYCAFVGASLSLDDHGCLVSWYVAWWREFANYWFLHAYVGMMCFVPLINAVCEKGNARLLLPFLCLAFGWSWLASFNCTASFIPRSIGLASYSMLTLSGVYAVGRLIRVCNLAEKISLRWLVVVFVLTFSFGVTKLSQYNSPTAVCCASSVMLIVMAATKKFRLQDVNSLKLIYFLAPSMFSVYLLQVNSVVWEKIRPMVMTVSNHGVPMVIAFLTVAAGLFVGGVVVDLPRRLFLTVVGGRRSR